MELPNGLYLQNVRHISIIKVNLIALADLKQYKPRYQWETEEFLLHIDHTKTIRVPINDRLWPMHFKAMPTHRPRTPKQNSTATTTTTTKKAKGRALSLERRHQRLGNHLKLTNKELLCEPCTYGKHHVIPSRDVTEPTTTSYIADPTTSPTSELNTDQPTFRPTTRSMTRKSTS